MKKAFTLIELLVVIVIIATLAAILFPIFGRVRESARTTSCASNLKQLSLLFRGYLADNESYTPPIYWENLSTDPADPTGWIAHFPWVSIFKVTQGIMECPSQKEASGLSYSFNRFLWSWKPGCNILMKDGVIDWKGSGSARRINEAPSGGETAITYPSIVVTFFDWRGNDPAEPESPSDIESRREGWPAYPPSELNSSTRHNGKGNYAFWDGHAERLSPNQIKRDSKGGGGSDVYYVGRATLMPWYKNNEPWYDPGLLNGTPAAHTYACSINRWATGPDPTGTWPTFNIFR